MKKLIYLIMAIVALSLIIAGCGNPVVPPTEQNESGTLPNKASGDTWYVPGDYDTIPEAINAATGGETIIVKAGTYNLTSALALDEVDLVLKGEPGSKPKITTSGSNFLFNISASGVTVENFEIEKTDKSNQNIIYIGANDVTIKDNLIHGQFVMGDSQVERAMEITYALTGLNIDGNTIHSLRQPAYINASTGTISNNDVYNTKGWVIVSQSHLTFTNNTWGDGTLPNYYDIAIIKDSPEGANNYPDIVTMSEENNNAIIENQHSTYSPAILSIVHVDAATSGSKNGSILDPYEDISSAIPRVAPGGTVYVAAGTYNETFVIDKPLTLQGAGSASTIIDASGASGYYGIQLEVGGTSASQRLTIKGLTVKNSPHHGVLVKYDIPFAHVTLEDVVLTNNADHGMRINNLDVASDVEITGCEFINNGKNGLNTESNTIVNGLTIADSKFNENKYGIYLEGTINDVTILGSEFNNSNGGYGGYMTETGPLTNLLIEDSEFNNNVVGLMVWNEQDNADITITSTLFQDNDKWGVLIWGNTLTNVLIQDSEVLNNDGLSEGYYGIDFYTYSDLMDNVAVHYTNITGHAVGGGVKNRNEAPTAIVDATCNWWGHPGGPMRLNPGGEWAGPDAADRVSLNVDYKPWLHKSVK